eukprot:sb/3465981/
MDPSLPPSRGSGTMDVEIVPYRVAQETRDLRDPLVDLLVLRSRTTFTTLHRNRPNQEIPVPDWLGCLLVSVGSWYFCCVFYKRFIRSRARINSALAWDLTAPCGSGTCIERDRERMWDLRGAMFLLTLHIVYELVVVRLLIAPMSVRVDLQRSHTNTPKYERELLVGDNIVVRATLVITCVFVRTTLVSPTIFSLTIFCICRMVLTEEREREIYNVEMIIYTISMHCLVRALPFSLNLSSSDREQGLTLLSHGTLRPHVGVVRVLCSGPRKRQGENLSGQYSDHSSLARMGRANALTAHYYYRVPCSGKGGNSRTELNSNRDLKFFSEVELDMIYPTTKFQVSISSGVNDQEPTESGNTDP